MNERMHVRIAVGVLVLTALLILAGSSVAGNTAGPPDFYPTDAAFQSASFWSSGWFDIATDTAQVFTHDLGGDPDDYAVELWFRDTATGGKGINSWGVGGFEADGNFRGAYWQNLTDTTIEVFRHSDDVFADQVRLRVWIPDPPVWDSGWVSIARNQEKSLTHPVGGNVDDYTVGLWFKDTTPDGIGINTRCYGGLEVDGQLRGAHWRKLTSNDIHIVRYQDNDWADQVRVRIFVPDPPDYDSDWVDISPGDTMTLSHDLGGNPNLYLVRGWQRDAGVGINHMFAGGYEAGGSFFGTNWENLTDTTINFFRRPNDEVADQVRVRIWMREYKVFLPIVLKAH